MRHADFFALLERLSPTHLADSWDNVGLLLDPTPARPTVGAVLVAIDLTESVLDEALALGVDVVVAYHPPIFSGLKRITRAAPLTRRLLALAQAGVAVWSPHTALDAVAGGMNDWLAAGLGAATDCKPLQACAAAPEAHDVGLGRVVTLATPATLSTLVARLKAHLALAHVRVAAPASAAATVTTTAEAPLIHRVALCPGSGGSLFGKLPAPEAGGPQLYVTGEWGHHDVLAKVAAGAAVILTDHSNTERGFLPTYADWLRSGAPGVTVHVSSRDAEPLQVW